MGSSAHLRKGLAIWDAVKIIQNLYNYDSRVTLSLDVLRIDLIAILPSGIGIWVSKFRGRGPCNFKGGKRFRAWRMILPNERTGTGRVINGGRASRYLKSPFWKHLEIRQGQRQRMAIFPSRTEKSLPKLFASCTGEHSGSGLTLYYFKDRSRPGRDIV